MHTKRDKELAEKCIALRESTSLALSWTNDNLKLVGTQSDALKRELKLASVEARKLARAAQRPTSLAIFGPSQVGKSFLTGTLLLGSPTEESENKMGNVVFGEGEQATSLNFLTHVNPAGGQETTGLVTRFTRTKPMDTPPGYPVCLRLMSEIDVVKILANSFVEDLNLDSEISLSESAVNDLLGSLSDNIQSEQVDPLISEDIFELEQYLKDHLQSHPFSKELADNYWDKAAALAPRLKPNDRAKLYSLLWGGISSFSSLFNELKSALDMLGHPEWGFVALDAITDRMPGKTVLHVLTMKHGLADDLSKSEMGKIALADGRTFDLRKPVITALANEMRAQLEDTCWDFFDNTDLLDFPGARSRERVNRDVFFNTEKEPYPIGDAFLRGKVAVMFDNYAADLDLNTLVACHKAEQNSVTSFKHLVENWVNRTHGPTPEKRINVPVNLFMAVTWCDMLFDESFGQEQLDLSLDNKLSYLKNFCPSINLWTPDTPFNNTYFIRNPAGKKLDSLYDIETLSESPPEWSELGYREDAKDKLTHYRESFLKTEVSVKYFTDQATRWDAMTKPNDGGVTLLAESLGKACNPDVKFKQLSPKEEMLRKSLGVALTPFYEGDDVNERVTKRCAAIEEVIENLRSNISLVPKFVSQFQLDQKFLRELYIGYRRNHLFGVADGLEERESIGEVAVKAWIRNSESLFENDLFGASYRLSQDHIRSVISELEAGLRRVDAAETITQRVNKIEQFAPGSTRHAEYIATTIALMLNDFVNFVGCKGDILSGPDASATLFNWGESVTEDNMPILKEHTAEMNEQRNRFAEDWFTALLELTRGNASSSKGSLINIEENARLGQILAKLS